MRFVIDCLVSSRTVFSSRLVTRLRPHHMTLKLHDKCSYILWHSFVITSYIVASTQKKYDYHLEILANGSASWCRVDASIYMCFLLLVVPETAVVMGDLCCSRIGAGV